MKTNLTLVIVVATAIFSLSAAKQGNDTTTGICFFNGTYKEALAEAKKQHKLIFIDGYTTWCSPCKLLANTTFTDKNVAQYFNEHFINVAINMEKGEGPELVAKYKITLYPTLLITDEDGNRVTFTVGYIHPDDLLGFAKYGVEKTSFSAALSEN